MEQLEKALVGNDVWAMAIVDPASGTTLFAPTSTPADLSALLTEFQDVFGTLAGLPPHHMYDHSENSTLKVMHQKLVLVLFYLSTIILLPISAEPWE